MALFKVLKGNRAALDSQVLHDGYAYFCVDDGSFHIDYTDADGNLQRKQLNAKDAETVMGQSLIDLQPDWSINDPANPAYVQNRTHWTEAGKKLIVDEQTVNHDFVDLAEYLPANHNMRLGQTYVVTVNGISYTCETWACNGVYYIGNSRLHTEFEDIHPEDVPFLISYEGVGGWGGQEEIYFDITFPEHDTYTIKIEQLDDTLTTYHKLDENFIPDTIARVSQITDGVYYGTNDKSSSGSSMNNVVIKNFPYTLKDGICVIVNFPEEVLPNKISNTIIINITPTMAQDQFKPIHDRNNNPYNKTIPANSVKMLIYDGTNWRIDDVNEEVFITVEDIDTICGATIQSASEVMF